MMQRMRLWISAAIIAAAVLLAFTLSVPRTRDLGPVGPSSQSAEASAVTLHDALRKGVHTISGSVTAPDACTTASAEATLVGEATTTILVAIKTQRGPGVCLELPTEVPFETTLEAPPNLPIGATVNGVPAEITSS